MKTTPSLAKFYVIAAALGLPLAAHADRVSFGVHIGVPAPVYVRTGPPAVVYETAPVAPGPGYIWVAGHYSFQGGQWVYYPGAWTLPPQPGAYWVAGRYEGQNWIEAHWELAQTPPPPPVAAGEVVYADAPPPPPVQEQVVYATRPGPDFIWIGGYWGWNAGHRVWIGGHWDHPPRHGAVWVPARWDHRDGHYFYVRGYWR